MLSDNTKTESKSFVHLHLRTEYSLVDSIIRIEPLMDAITDRGMQAVAVTDHCNLFAAVKVYQAAIAAGVKPILGCDVYYYDPEQPDIEYLMVLLCQNEIGYRNLTRLVSKAYQQGQLNGRILVQRAWILEYAEGLIALSGGRQGDIGQALLNQRQDLACQRAKEWLNQFGNRFYIEIQRTHRTDEDIYNAAAVLLADNLTMPLVATNDVRFLDESDFDAHEARVCIHHGFVLDDEKRSKPYSAKQYVRSAEEMHVLFADLPQAIQNTVEISKRCTVILHLGHPCLPNFPTPANISIEHYLSQLSQEGLERRLQQLFPTQDIALHRQPYDERLKIELDVINSMGFAGYFLIVADFIRWAKSHDVPVGPGRGSGAGSLVAYALLITDLDPLAYDLLFERFLNPERVSMPDFDIDFCMDGRDRVIEYVAEKYGRQSVSQIITFGTMAAKAVVRDVGRVLGHPYGFVDKLAKLIPFELGITLRDALTREEELASRYANEEDVKELFDLALKLEGITRNAGKHAGGVVIAPSELTDFSAIYCEEGSSQLVSQFDKDDVEAAGLVKFDFLGLRTLTIIHAALKIINRARKTENLDPIDISTIPMDDEASFTLLKACQTTAVFQLESRGMKELIHRLQPDCFEDVIALVALFRPGPLQSGMVDDFIDRKHGIAAVVYPHPDLEPILKPTYGVILYQEQVMQIAQVLANYTLGGADLLRRAMGKKKPEEMAKQRTIFTEGAVARDVPLDTAKLIFDLMEKFAGYGFNKSHSAAYALIAYQTAWLKAHYPAAFMAAVMSSDMDNTDKVVGFIRECKNMHLNVLPPCINRSQYTFTVVDDRTLRYGLGAIKGVGESAIQCLVDERQISGDYLSLFDVCRRLDMRKINRRVLDALIKSGSMDVWEHDRAVLAASLEKAMQSGVKYLENQRSGQQDMFSVLEAPTDQTDYMLCQPYSLAVRLEGEKETLGLYLTGHPTQPYLAEFASFIQPISQLDPFKMKHIFVCGLVTTMRTVITKRGKKLIILSLENDGHHIDVIAFAERIESQLEYLAVGRILVVEGDLQRDEYNGGHRIITQSILTLDEVRARFAKCLALTLSSTNEPLVEKLKLILQRYPGQCVVQIRYANSQVRATMNLGLAFRVRPEQALFDLLSQLISQQNIELCYT